MINKNEKIMENKMLKIHFKLPGQFITDNDLEAMFKRKIVVIKDNAGTGKTTLLKNIFNKLTLPSKTIFIDDLSFGGNKKLLRETIQRNIENGVFIFITTDCNYSVINYYLKPYFDYFIYDSVFMFNALNGCLGDSTSLYVGSREECYERFLKGEITNENVDTEKTDMNIINEFIAERDKIHIAEILKSNKVLSKKRL
ncbi:hypothetical protein DRK05_24325 [Salmonella enterica subsp. enterica serovar Anatum]|nr:hypothetical protein [Salmonella enterica subsp. enterica serovar Anatum]EDK0674067.1 hypothetical protein [Salmonella enterica]EDS7835040.1 hypothetical protein [Salmonella enterica subsp. enterica serovar Anatum]EDZ1192918.1 hypothetical protein [Salmonella enterica]